MKKYKVIIGVRILILLVLSGDWGW